MRKGFTLVEILAVIIILGLIGLIAIPSVTRMIEESKENLYNKQVEVIKEHARKWSVENIDRLSENQKNYVSVNSLISEGYIEQNELNNPKKTKETMDGCVVIDYNKSYEKFEYNYIDGSCREATTDYDLTINDPEYNCYYFNPTNQYIEGYELDNEDCPTDLYIPSKIDGMEVRGIGDYAFDADESDRYITSVQFPKSIRYIGEAAFKYNQISDLDLSGLENLEYIGEEAFYYNSIMNLNLQGLDSLSRIGMDAFASNYITELIIKDLPKLERIEEDAFYDNYIREVVFENLPRFKYIGECAFCEGILSTLSFDNVPELEIIGECAFCYNNLTSLNLIGLTNLRKIDRYAFADNNLESVSFNGLESLVEIGISSFEDNNLQKLTIKDLPNLEYIASGAFKYNSLTSVTLKNLPKLYGIGSNESVELGWNFVDQTVIRTNFMEQNTIRASLLKQGITNENLFKRTTVLLSVSVKKEYLSGTFADNYISSIILEDLPALEYIGNYAFRYNYISTVTLKDLPSLQSIGGYAFEENEIRTLSFDNVPNLTMIDDGAFAINQLSSVVIPASVIEIGYDAFYPGCSTPWQSITILGDPNRFNDNWESIGWPCELNPNGEGCDS